MVGTRKVPGTALISRGSGIDANIPRSSGAQRGGVEAAGPIAAGHVLLKVGEKRRRRIRRLRMIRVVATLPLILKERIRR